MRLAGLVCLGAIAAVGQQAQFEVAAIKPNHGSSTESNMNSLPGGRLAVDNMTVQELVKFAYGVKDHQMDHAPRWIENERFDIAAKTATGKKASLEDEQAQIRGLLEDRFQLKTHRETRQMNVYLLVVGKDGVKLTRHDDGAGSGTRKGCGRLTGKRLTLDTIASVLSRQFDREVLNRTELPGKYDFQLEWTPDAGPCPAAEGGGGAAANLPSIFTAIQQQLGLKLEPSKGPVEILVIDRVERPSEN
jgi:uncharacterized protein (TIGR03435 family)